MRSSLATVVLPVAALLVGCVGRANAAPPPGLSPEAMEAWLAPATVVVVGRASLGPCLDGCRGRVVVDAVLRGAPSEVIDFIAWPPAALPEGALHGIFAFERDGALWRLRPAPTGRLELPLPSRPEVEATLERVALRAWLERGELVVLGTATLGACRDGCRGWLVVERALKGELSGTVAFTSPPPTEGMSPWAKRRLFVLSRGPAGLELKLTPQGTLGAPPGVQALLPR